MPQVRAIVRDAAAQRLPVLGDLILGIVNSDAFRMQAPPHEAGDKNHATLTTLAAVPHPDPGQFRPGVRPSCIS